MRPHVARSSGSGIMTSDSIGGYQIVEELGRGGMGTVYRGFDPTFNRAVAIKVLPREFLHDPTFRERFRREAQALAGMEHSAIVPVYDSGEEEGQPYLVMRFMAGGSLVDRLQHGPLTPDAALTILRRIAAALDAVHRRGFVHRDVKPANILFDKHGDAYLGDFGIVKLEEATTELTGSRIIGTPSYLAPEMAESDAPSPLTDVYALGITLYEMLTGSVPYKAPTPIGTILAHVREPIPDILHYRPDIPPAMRDVINRALAKHPAQRYQSAGDLVRGLEQAIASPEVAWTPTEVPAAGGAGGQPLADAMTTPLFEMPAVPDPGATQIEQQPYIYGGPGLQTPAARPAGGGFPWMWVLVGGLGVLILAACLAVIVLLAGDSLGLGSPADSGNNSGEGRDEETDEPADEPTEEPTDEPENGPPTEEATQPPPPDEPTAAPTEEATEPPSTGSPAGQIVYTCYDGSFDHICLMNADGSNQRQLTFAGATEYFASPSPDGSRIAFSSRRGGAFDLYLMDTSGDRLTQLTADHGSNFSPDISPDGSRIVFTSTANDTYQHIWVMNSDGSGLKQLTYGAGDQLDAVWSPDGTQILYAAQLGEKHYEQFVMNADGSNPRQLTFDMFVGGRCDWSPDGRTLAFFAGPEGDRDLFLMNPDGSNVRQITFGGDNKAPSFSPDGAWIAFASKGDGDNEIVIIRLDGSDWTPLTFNGLADWQPLWGW